MSDYSFIKVEFHDMDFSTCIYNAIMEFIDCGWIGSTLNQEILSDKFSKYVFGQYCIQQADFDREIDFKMLEYFKENVKLTTHKKFPENSKCVVCWTVNVHTLDVIELFYG